MAENMLHSLMKITRPTKVMLETRIIPPMRKTNNPFYGEIEEYMIVEGIIAFNYQNRVNSQRIEEMLPPTFKSAPRQWGIRVRNSPLVYHNKKFYLEVMCQELIFREYRYIGTNIPVDELDVEPFIIKGGESARQQLDNPIICRDFALENIVSWQKIEATA